MKKEVNKYLCKKCGLEFPESEFSGITEKEEDICPACGGINCFKELEDEHGN